MSARPRRHDLYCTALDSRQPVTSDLHIDFKDGCGLLLAGLAYSLNRAGQLPGSPWFQEYSCNPLGGGALSVEALMRATAQNDWEIGPEPLEFACERHARHAGHGGVGDDEVKPSRCRPKRV